MRLHNVFHCASVSLFLSMYVHGIGFYLFAVVNVVFVFKVVLVHSFSFVHPFKSLSNAVCLQLLTLFLFFREVTPSPQKNQGSNLLKQKHLGLELTMWTNKRS